KKGGKINRFAAYEGISALTLSPLEPDASNIGSGDMTFAVSGEHSVSYQEYWYRGSWFDNIGVFWQDFTAYGDLKNRTYSADPSGKLNEDVASLAVRVGLNAGETRRVRFILTWNHPNNYNDWNEHEGTKNRDGSFVTWKNYYALLFNDSVDSALYGLRNWDRLEGESRRFKDALFSSSLPEEALDAVAANIAVLKTPTVWRLEDGTFYGWEGTWPDQGSCEGSCTHVWNYTYALPFLFPKLERSMREADYAYNLRPDGGMPFRIQLPLGTGRSSFRPCVDGQMGGVIKTYREWKILGDNEWLRRLWPSVKKSLEFAWSPENKDRWDPEKSGVITGRQHHTLDMELFGPNSWLQGFYLGALKAASEMAEVMGDQDAGEYLALFEKGRAWADKNLYNGEYFIQQLDLKNKELIKSFEDNATLTGETVIHAYWNDEAGEMKYQYAQGCEIDQVIAQWHANLTGLGRIFDPAKVRSALKAIHRYNYKPSLRFHFNPCRIYGHNDEAGTVICEWPDNVHKPVIPLPYAEECMHGFEYQAAIHMIQEGMEKEGLEMVAGIRNRYTGENRNPWNEIECGSNYARSMASYALLLAYSGFSCNMSNLEIGFAPLREGSYFWSLDKAWGVFEQKGKTGTLRVLYGTQRLKRVRLGWAGIRDISLGEAKLSFKTEETTLVLDEPLVLNKGQALVFM
ncbi:MAG: glycoside hydrolase family 116 protein, partial [Treponema sp.]|nr:glycoside hydrolase family 116 protein [Treponema sp.]